MKNYNTTRKRPVVHYSISPETKDLIDTIAIATGKNRSIVVDKLLQYLATQHTVEEFIHYVVE